MRVRWLVALTALALAGCGSANKSADSESTSTGSGASGGSTTAKVAFVYPTTTTNFAQEMALGAKAAADDTPGVNLTEAAPAEVNGPKQVQLFQAATRTSKDGVAMMTLTPTCSSARCRPRGRRTSRWSRSTSRRPRAPGTRSSC